MAYDEPFIAGTRAASGPTCETLVCECRQWREIREVHFQHRGPYSPTDVQNYDQIETSCYWVDVMAKRVVVMTSAQILFY